MGRGNNSGISAARGTAAPTRSAANAAASRRKRPMTAEQKERIAKIEETIKDLDESLTTLSPREYREWLRDLPRMYKYSLNNYRLIRMQNPNSTRIAAFGSWKKQGRVVKKGEKAMFILIPVPIKNPVLDGNGRPALDADGNPRVHIFNIFRPKASVFDISQTEVMEGHEDTYTETTQSAEKCVEDVITAAEAQGIEVFRGETSDEQPYHRALSAILLNDPDTGGFYVPAEEMKDKFGVDHAVIVTRPGVSVEEEAHTLAHEFGHAILHANRSEDSANVKEVEAESVAFVITSDYGIESNFSASYIHNWSEDKKENTKELKASSARIRSAVTDFFEQRDLSAGVSDSAA